MTFRLPPYHTLVSVAGGTGLTPCIDRVVEAILDTHHTGYQHIFKFPRLGRLLGVMRDMGDQTHAEVVASV